MNHSAVGHSRNQLNPYSYAPHQSCLHQNEGHLVLSASCPRTSEAWFTDGSKTDEGTGSGIFGPNTEISISFDNFASVFQTEVVAISTCALHISSTHPVGQCFEIFSDSQAAIKSLESPYTNSVLVRECKRNLNNLAVHNMVKVVWIPGHSGLDGNEKADSLARQGSASLMIGPAPSLPVGWFEAIAEVDRWTNKLSKDYWASLSGLNQSKRLLNPLIHSKLSNINRKDLKLLTGYLTGHHPTNSYLFRIHVRDDPICRLCQRKEETTSHILMSCWRLAAARTRILGKPVLLDLDIQSSKSIDIIKFLRIADKLLL